MIGECSVCKKMGELKAHHVVPKYLKVDFPYAITMSIAVCQDCHDVLHQSLLYTLKTTSKLSSQRLLHYTVLKTFLKKKYPLIWGEFKGYLEASIKELIEESKSDCEDAILQGDLKC